MRWPGSDSRSRAGLWDDQIDGEAPKPSDRFPTGKGARRSRLAIIVRAVCVAPLLLWALFMAAALVDHIRFEENVAAVDRRARGLGGGVGHGRRHYRYHVGIWSHGKEIDNRAMPEITSIVRECRERGLDEESLSLNLDGTSAGDEGIRHLRGMAGLKSLSIRDTRVTGRGVKSLRESMPGTAVYPWSIPIHKTEASRHRH